MEAVGKSEPLSEFQKSQRRVLQMWIYLSVVLCFPWWGFGLFRYVHIAVVCMICDLGGECLPCVLCLLWVCVVGCCGWWSSEFDGCHVCSAVPWVVCFLGFMVCLVLEMGLSVCGVFFGIHACLDSALPFSFWVG